MFENNNGQNRINNIIDDSNYEVKKKKGMPAWAIALIVIVCNIVISCMIILGIGFRISSLFNNTNTDTDTQEKKSVNGLALEYMEEKYGERFYYYSPWGNSLSDTRQFLAVCDSMPDQQVLVQIDNYRTDNKVFRDNYLAVKYQQEVTDYLHERFTKYYSNVQVLHIPSKWALSPNLDTNADFETYLADNNCSISAYVVLDVNELESEDSIEDILNNLVECKGSIKLSILFLDNTEEKYNDPDILRDIVRDKLYVRLALVGIEADDSYIIWKEGV